MAETSTVGGVISGYWAMASVQTAMNPARVMMIDSTVAKIGRLMKKRENTARLSMKRQGEDETRRPDGVRAWACRLPLPLLVFPCLAFCLSPCLHSFLPANWSRGCSERPSFGRRAGRG